MSILCCLALIGTAGPGGLPTESFESSQLVRFEYTRIIMGVEARLVFYSKNEEDARDAAAATWDRLNALDAILSDYRMDSELLRLCRAQADLPHKISPDLYRVLDQALFIAGQTDGAFDPTVGPVVQLWRKARQTGIRPDPNKLARARALVGYTNLVLDEKDQTATLAKPGMRLDLGGIAKGYAADEAIRTLAARGITSALVDLGGDLTASGPPPGKPAWRVEVDTGVDTPKMVDLVNAAMATSGDLVQHVIIDGVRYSHIIDPRSGEPLTTGIAATVTASTGMLADALASAACVLGNRARALIEPRFPGVRVQVATGGFKHSD